MRSRWRRHPRWAWALARRRLRWQAHYYLVFTPARLYAYHWVYRGQEERARTIKSVYWLDLQSLRTQSNPLMELLDRSRRT